MTEPILITPDLIDARVDFEKGMSPFPRASILLIAFLLAVFVLQFVLGAMGDAAAFVRFGALDSASVRGGEVWRLLSATFMHASWDHLIGNAFALLVAGMACEHAFGSVQFLVLYFAAALCGSAASTLGLPAGVPGVGASGAVFGLIGAAACVILRNTKRLYVRDKRIGLVLAAWVVWSIALGVLTPFVDNFAHLGGLAGGVLVSLALRPVVLERGRPLPVGIWPTFAASCLAVAATIVVCALRLTR